MKIFCTAACALAAFVLRADAADAYRELWNDRVNAGIDARIAVSAVVVVTASSRRSGFRSTTAVAATAVARRPITSTRAPGAAAAVWPAKSAPVMSRRRQSPEWMDSAAEGEVAEPL